jgi:hypothetical protein
VACANNSATHLRDSGRRVTGEVVEVHTERRDNTVVVSFPYSGATRSPPTRATTCGSRSRELATAPNSCATPTTCRAGVADVRMGPDFLPVWALTVGEAA